MLFERFKISALSLICIMSLSACQTTKNALDKYDRKNKEPKQTININAVSPEGVGKKIGTITFQDSPRGLSIRPNLSDLPSGFHGFHIHEKGSCAPAIKNGRYHAAAAAGNHFNPLKVRHGSPNDGHLGDLPVLNVDSTGVAKTVVIAPRLKRSLIQGLSIVIHAGGDNYSDYPKPLGGDGDRIACGVIR